MAVCGHVAVVRRPSRNEAADSLDGLRSSDGGGMAVGWYNDTSPADV